MTTLSEKLNEKIKQDSVQSLWDEIEKLFLSLDYRLLHKGVTVRIFQNCKDSPLYYIIGDGASGTAFSEGYDLDTFRRVIPICEENGLIVRPFNNQCFELKFIP